MSFNFFSFRLFRLSFSFTFTLLARRASCARVARTWSPARQKRFAWRARAALVHRRSSLRAPRSAPRSRRAQHVRSAVGSPRARMPLRALLRHVPLRARYCLPHTITSRAARFARALIKQRARACAPPLRFCVHRRVPCTGARNAAAALFATRGSAVCCAQRAGAGLPRAARAALVAVARARRAPACAYSTAAIFSFCFRSPFGCAALPPRRRRAAYIYARARARSYRLLYRFAPAAAQFARCARAHRIPAPYNARARVT